MHKVPKLANRIIALFLIMCIFLSNSNVLLKTAIMSIAADGTETAEIALNQEITKYIPYSYSAEDQGIILQQSISMANPIADQTQESKITLTIPTYATIEPETIATKSQTLTKDETKTAYYKIEDGTLTIFQKKQTNEEYYITYYYSETAYDKYLDTTHVKEYENGVIVSISKDQETGETWVFIDYEWEAEPGEGEEPPSNMRIMDKTPIQINTQCEITTEEGTLAKTNELAEEVDIAIGCEITNKIQTNIAEISKGKIYTGKEITYEIENQINITRSDIFTSMQIEDLGSKFISKTDTTKYQATVTNNSIVISKENFEKILGQDGSIKILDTNSQVIATIDSNITENEDGNYIATYPENTEKIKIEITGIKNNGFLNIKQNRTITGDQGYIKSEMEDFKTFKTTEKTTISSTVGNPQSSEQTVEIQLTETTTSANLKINNNNLSTEFENTGIEFAVELKNNNENSDTWDNPFVIIEMPNEVADIRINNKNILYGEGLTLQSASVIELNGNKAIKVQLVGTQKDFVASTILGGTTIVVNANITLKELTATGNDNQIKLYYFNENKIAYENSTTINLEQSYEVGLNTILVNYIAPIGFKTIHKIVEYDSEGNIVNSENSEKEVGKINILEPEREVKQTITIMNNTGNETTDVKVIGRIPFVGNTDIVTGEALQTTIDAIFSESIVHTGGTRTETESEDDDEKERTIEIYYSENGNADIDLEKTENGWLREVESLDNIKTFMIVISDVQQAEKVYFEYSIKIPAMLQHNENLYSPLATYYTNNTEIGKVEEVSKVNTIGLTTGIGARAEIQLSANIATDAIVSEGQQIEYTIKVSNTGELSAQDVVIINPIPAGTTYVEETVVENEMETFNKYTYYSASNELRWNLGEMAANQTVELKYTVIVNNVPSILAYYGAQEGFIEENGAYYIVSTNEAGEQIKTPITDTPDIVISNKAVLQASNIEKELYSNELNNEVKKTYLKVTEKSSIDKVVYIQENQEYEYILIIENKTDAQVENVQITKKIPQGITYKETEILVGNATIDYSEETLTITSDKLGAYEIMEIKIKVCADKLAEGEYKKEITTNTEIKSNGTEINTTSSVTNTIGRPHVTATIECDEKQRYIYEKDFLNYVIKITNQNDVTASKLTLTNIIPEGTKFITGSYEKIGEEYAIISDGTRNIVVEANLKQETITIKIKVQVETIDTNVEEIDIVNKAVMKANNVEETIIGEIKHTIINTESSSGGNTGDGTGTDDGNTGDDGDGGGSGSGDGNASGDNGNTGSGSGEAGEDGVIRYKIKGSVWNDANKDGERQDDEDIISGIKVYLINENGEVIKDYKTGQEKIAITDLDGEYEFKNIEKGRYIVIFMYDNTMYNITEYQKTGVVNDRNSDAILKDIIFEGSQKHAGVTDIIQISDRNLYSIDLGLAPKAKFNMMLEAGVSNITIQTKDETKQIAYDMEDLTKVEIRASKLNGAQVIIEYNLKIINNGELPGSVNQIMANKVNGLTFTSSLNKEWYQGNDSNLYLSSLTNIVLQPGESTNAKLVLVKQMTSSNTGTIENNFTITKTYNDSGTEETTLEDNYKKVTIIITTSTGKTIAYTGISIMALSILAIGVYIMRKKFTEEKRWI